MSRLAVLNDVWLIGKVHVYFIFIIQMCLLSELTVEMILYVIDHSRFGPKPIAFDKAAKRAFYFYPKPEPNTDPPLGLLFIVVSGVDTECLLANLEYR